MINLHIVCFDIPFPANYGGAIDVYYRLRVLAEAGVGIILHCTYKGELTHHRELEKLCEKVYYYPRKISVAGLFDTLPLAVSGRPNKDILRNLLSDDAPILYEGLVSCGTMNAPELRRRKKYFREGNVEHNYYRALAEASKSFLDRCYYRCEARRLERFENVLRYANGIFALAHQDEEHFRTAYPMVETSYIPCFHAHTKLSCGEGCGKGILYHGNLRVEENRKAAEYIMREIAPELPEIPFVVAGANAGNLRSYSENVTLLADPGEEEMRELVETAQIHLLVTFQATGLKLKLLNVLYEGRHVVCNADMVCGTELATLCHVMTDTESLIEQCKKLYTEPFTKEMAAEREEALRLFDNRKLAEKVVIKLTQ